jgi:hypothetical protein
LAGGKRIIMMDGVSRIEWSHGIPSGDDTEPPALDYYAEVQAGFQHKGQILQDFEHGHLRV